MTQISIAGNLISLGLDHGRQLTRLCFRSSRKEDAFTLLELLVVTTLISIMLAVAVPALRDTLFTDQLKASTRKIIGMVKGVREEAIRKQLAVPLHIDTDEGAIWYEDVALASGGSTNKIQLDLPSSVKIVDVWTKSAGRNDAGVLELSISKQGYMDHTVIHLSDDSDANMSIVFSPFLGSIEVFDEYISLE